MIQNMLLLLNAIVAFSLVVLILLQRQDAGAGGIMGGANAAAAPTGRNPLAKTTGILAIIFMGSCLLLAVTSTGKGKDVSMLDELATPTVMEETAPVVPEIPIPTPVQN